MRLVTWNCFRGDALIRAAAVADLAPDLLILQECARPTAADPSRVQCFGDNPKHGLAIVATSPFRLIPLVSPAPSPRSVGAAWVEGPGLTAPLLVLAVWAQREPSYVQAILTGLDAYAPLLRAHPAVVLGDFNSHPSLDRGRAPTHASLVARLEGEYGLRSAFRAVNGIAAPEPPTHYWRWKAANGFHIDYCFIPEAWRQRVRAAWLPDEPPGSRSSDHRPLVVDVELTPDRPEKQPS